MIASARLAAFHILEKVLDGGYASDLLHLECKGIDSRDAGLASEIVFGVLRYQVQLDHLIAHFAGRPQPGLAPAVRLALRMGIYQLRYLDRIPPHAAVGESVELVKNAKKGSASGFVNAVLRKVNRDPVQWPDRATELSCPPWLLARWNAQYGVAGSTRIAQEFLKAPETYVRIPAGSVHELEVEPTSLAGCYRLISGDPKRFRLQDIGSQSIVPLLDLSAGQTYLDVCAAPGNKTAQALETPIKAVACDLHYHRLRMLDRMPTKRVVLDATAPLPFRQAFDRILVDAPCSGTGTLGRNPEIKWRLNLADIADLQKKQTAILSNALPLLAPGGQLVYSTCSLESEENQGVVERVLHDNPQFAQVKGLERIPGKDPGDGFYAAVIKFR